MRVTLLHNPGAGDGTPADALLAALADAGHEVAYEATTRDLAAVLDDPGDLVLVAGGDGAVKAVAVHLAGRGIPLAALPFGTANNIAKSLNALGETRELIEGLARATPRMLDVGTARAPWGECCFVESVGAGIFTRLIERAGTEVDGNPSAWTGNEIDRALQLLRQIVASQRPERWTVGLDGNDLSGEYLLVEAMNIRLLGPNIPLAPDADPGDGELDVVLLGGDDRAALLAYVDGRLHGHVARPEFPVHRGRALRLITPPSALHVDDAPWTGGGSLPPTAREITVSLDRGTVELLVPRRDGVSAPGARSGSRSRP